MKKILAIDDNEINLELLNQLITKYYPDYDFIRAFNGTEGIDKARLLKPELILLDILMPGLNGYEVCEILKSDSQTGNIPVLMISALGGNPAERTRGLNAGADAFISKPFMSSELQAQINVALRIKGVEDLLRKRNEMLELSIKTEADKFLFEEQRFHQISEHARQFYWEVDKQGEFIYISPVVETILKKKIMDILGRISFNELFQTETHNKHVKLTDSGKIEDCEIFIKTGKNDLWLTISGFPVFNELNCVTGTRGICFDVTQRKKAELALMQNLIKIEKYQDKLKKLNTEITRIEEKERRRIAENLHDSLGQTLSLAYLKLSALNPDGFTIFNQSILNDTFNLLNKAISESRDLTYDLSPPILYELGLIPTFKWKLEQIEQKYALKTRLKGEEIVLNLKKEIAIFVYRIVSELIQNVIKHANATELTIEIEKSQKKCFVSVCDNGIGINSKSAGSASKQGGFGLMSIKERLGSFKGHLSMKSELGKGTTARIEIPLK